MKAMKANLRVKITMEPPHVGCYKVRWKGRSFKPERRH